VRVALDASTDDYSCHDLGRWLAYRFAWSSGRQCSCAGVWSFSLGFAYGIQIYDPSLARPCFSAEAMTGLARWKKPRERMIFILCGRTSLRIGERLGIEIRQAISVDFLILYIKHATSSSRESGRTA